MAYTYNPATGQFETGTPTGTPFVDESGQQIFNPSSFAPLADRGAGLLNYQDYLRPDGTFMYGQANPLYDAAGQYEGVGNDPYRRAAQALLSMGVYDPEQVLRMTARDARFNPQQLAQTLQQMMQEGRERGDANSGGQAWLDQISPFIPLAGAGLGAAGFLGGAGAFSGAGAGGYGIEYGLGAADFAGMGGTAAGAAAGEAANYFDFPDVRPIDGGVPNYFDIPDTSITNPGGDVPNYFDYPDVSPISGLPGGTQVPMSLDEFIKSLTNVTSGGTYQVPWGNLLGAILEGVGNFSRSDDLRDLFKEARDSDLWRGQQPRYFDPLYAAATQGLGNTDYGRSIMEDAAEAAAPFGLNLSTNQVRGMGEALNRGTTDYIRALGPLAMGRPMDASIYTNLGSQMVNAGASPWGALGYGLESLFTGQQPSALQQYQGTPRNQTLPEFLRV